MSARLYDERGDRICYIIAHRQMKIYLIASDIEKWHFIVISAFLLHIGSRMKLTDIELPYLSILMSLRPHLKQAA